MTKKKADEMLNEVREQLGYDRKYDLDRYGCVSFHLVPPAISLDEKIDALCEHLGLLIKKKKAVPSKVVVEINLGKP
jgi:hypothetical protein